MLRNEADQFVGAQLTTIADGSPFTGTVTVYITLDNGSQTLGSVSSGVAVHKGNGYHSYAPSDAETDADHIAYTFVGSGAYAETIQVRTQTIDVSKALSDPMPESYAVNGSEPTIFEALYAIHQMLMEHQITGSNWEIRKLDNATPAFIATLNDAINPTAVSRLP